MKNAKTTFEVTVRYETNLDDTGTSLKQEREVWRDEMKALLCKPEFKVTRFSIKVLK